MTETDHRPTTGRPEDSDGAPSVLDRRREKMQVTKAAAGEASTAVESLDQQLESNAGRTTGYESDLQATLDRVAWLKKSIKAAAKEYDRLKVARKDARRVATSTQHRADQAESKYDAAVLAELLRREKDHDLSVHGDSVASDPATPDSAAPDAGRPNGAATPDADTSEATAEPAEAAKPRARSTRATTARTSTARASSNGTASTPRRRSTTTTRSRAAAADSTGAKTDDAPDA